MKKALILVAVLVFNLAVSAQSVADLAKREKSRREAFKGRHAQVVKNIDLLRVRKVAAVEITTPDRAVDETALAEIPEIQPETEGQEEEGGVLPSGSGAPSSRRIVPRVSADGPVLIEDSASGEPSFAGRTLDAQLKAANELVDLLETKMSALRQQFEYQDAMVPGYVIQQQLDETNQRLLKAQAQQARIQAMIDKKGAIER
jgi:hypothetical protein